MLGRDAGPYTFRNLVRVVRLKREESWDHTAAIVASILNARTGMKKHQMVNAEKLNPYRTRKRTGGKIRIADMARGFGIR